MTSSWRLRSTRFSTARPRTRAGNDFDHSARRRVSRGRFSNIIYFSDLRKARKGAETKDFGLFSIRAVVVKRFQATNSNFCRSRARAALRDQPLALPAWDQQEETEQSDSRTDRGRAIDTRAQSELVSSIVPRGTSLRWIVVLSLRQFGVRRSDCRRHFPCPAELGSITPHAMHNHGEPSCQCDDGFFLPPTLGNVHRPCLQPRPFLHAGQHDLRGLIEQRSHGLVAT